MARRRHSTEPVSHRRQLPSQDPAWLDLVTVRDSEGTPLEDSFDRLDAEWEARRGEAS